MHILVHVGKKFTIQCKESTVFLFSGLLGLMLAMSTICIVSTYEDILPSKAWLWFTLFDFLIVFYIFSFVIRFSPDKSYD